MSFKKDQNRSTKTPREDIPEDYVENSIRRKPKEELAVQAYSCTDVFLGPVCEYALAPVCRFASVWDTPVLTPGGHPHAFDFKENFPSLTRLRGFDTEVGHLVG
ncbi:Atrial natriuretic peptide receptor 3 [Armadillidium nasatum]|uniref:Atrial natriuretic peptide receptor 3 n=1 Tax=Armadillidium nasatum TaxID=96803 RepID=A0A5N5SMD8_9CRUS|nr:Atrial natriuretic peptide receptor 3 [Armadillidium nasatum]